MANKKIYRNVKNSSGTVVSLYDRYTGRYIPIDESNADYQSHLLLVAQGKALALDAGQALPNGVTDADVKPSQPKLGIEPAH